MAPRIRIDGPTAILTDVPSPAASLRDCLSFLHPKRRFSRAFRERRWDGYVRYFDGCRFPSGYAKRVQAHLDRAGIEARIISRGSGSLDASLATPNYLRGVTLWAHQVGAIRAMLQRSRGTLEEPTGSGKTAVMAAAARIFWEEKGWRSLIVVPRRGLARQTHAAFDAFYGGDIEVGMVGDGARQDGNIVIGTAATLAHFKDRKEKKRGSKKQQLIKGDPWLKALIERTDVLFVDECHRTSSEEWQIVVNACPAFRRYGLSGTPFKGDELDDLKLEGSTGPLIHRTTYAELQASSLCARPKIAMVMADGSSEPERNRTVNRSNGRSATKTGYRDAYDRCVVDSEKHNRAVIACVRWLLARKRRVLVFCRLKRHFVKLAEMLSDAGVEAGCLWGSTPTPEREELKELFASREIDCLLATTVFDEGEDVKGVDAIVLAEGVSVNTSALQRVGRGMRKDSSEVWVVDFVPMADENLAKHALSRCEIYERAGYDVQVVEHWPTSDRTPPVRLLPFESWDETPA